MATVVRTVRTGQGDEMIPLGKTLIDYEDAYAHIYADSRDGFKIKAQRLVEEFDRAGILHKKINRYFQAHLVLTGQTAACNRLHDIAERLARWLLMCHDRMEADNFTITHEFLGHMLGTPRSTVTLAARILNKSGLIAYSRGKVFVKDRNGLEKAACECYQAIRKEFDQLGVTSA